LSLRSRGLLRWGTRRSRFRCRLLRLCLILSGIAWNTPVACIILRRRTTIIGSFVCTIVSAARCLIAGRLVASSLISWWFSRVHLGLRVEKHFQGAVRALSLIAKRDQALEAADLRIIIGNSRGQVAKEVLLS
jgi:hypothetical protein